MADAPGRTDGTTSAQDHEAAAAFVRGRDIACPGCGYNLRDALGGSCPECGRPLVLLLDDPLPVRRAALWVSCAWCGLIGACFLGYEAITWYLAGGRPRRYGVQDGLETLLLLAMLGYALALLVMLLRTRGRRWAKAKSWLIVGWALWGLSAAVILWNGVWVALLVLAADL